LLPDGSLLLDHPDLKPHLGKYEVEALSWVWRAADPRVDALQRELAALVETDTASGVESAATFASVRAAVHEAGGAPSGVRWPAVRRGPTGVRPRLTEPWFCCSEPTERQMARASDQDLVASTKPTIASASSTPLSS